MKKTLLELVQKILNDMDSDEVNSIDDTVESEQVAEIVRQTYESQIAVRDWPHTRRLVKLIASADNAYPVHMTLETAIKKFCFINYNVSKTAKREYRPVRYLDPEAFLRRQNNLNPDNASVDVIQDYTGVELLIKNNKAPEYYTSFDDKNLVFDSYDSSIEDTLQNVKVQAMAYVIPEWQHVDDFVPDLPEEAFPGLFQEALSRSQMKLRQFTDSKAEQDSARQQRWLSRKARNIGSPTRYPDYGRKGRKRGRDVTFESGRH